MTQRKLSYIWLGVGVLLSVIGLVSTLLGNLGSILTLGIGILITYTGIFQLGGWPSVKYDIKQYFKTRKRAKPAPKKKLKYTKKDNVFRGPFDSKL